MELTPLQAHIREYPLTDKVFLRGEAGTGKTTAAVSRLEKMLINGISSESILVLVPQRPLARPYSQIASHPDLPPGGRLSILTIGGLARRMDELFWPLICENAGFTHPEIAPQFLTVETTQYFLSLIVDPLREKGYFDGLSIEPLRLYSQILDNLNKSAVVGFSLEEIGPRLRAAWIGNQADARFFDQAQECAVLFRQYCLDHSLLDFSLQLDVFSKTLWVEEVFQEYIHDRYHHLIYENVEEDYPTAHDIIR
ncbi:MAG TPA: DEAD/DEAH box helicase family protein, partial [Leptolinea sp.]